jgi:hypothetical protein
MQWTSVGDTSVGDRALHKMAATDFGCDERFMRLLKLDASLPGHPTSQQSSRLSIRAPRAGKVHALPHIFCHVATVNPSDLHLLYLATRTTHPIRGVVAAFMPYALMLCPSAGIGQASAGIGPIERFVEQRFEDEVGVQVMGMA